MSGSVYTPDCWTFVRITEKSTGNTHDRVLCSWVGGFARGDSWKLSSGNMKVIDKGDHWEVPQHSGSTYILAKTAERMSMMMGNVLHSLQKTDEALVAIEIITVEQAISQ